MINLKIVSTVPQGACSYYRAYGPLQKLENVMVHALPEFRWEWLTDTDIVFFERPASPNHVEAIEICREMGIASWIDYDDDLFSLPRWNPAVKFYSNEQNRQAIKDCIRLADVTTVATPRIKEVYSEFGGRVEVIPNAFNDYFLKWEDRLSPETRVLWRGSNTHRGDITPYGFGFVKNNQKFSAWTWHFFGGKGKDDVNDLWYITEMMENSTVYPVFDSIRYFKNLRELNPAVYIAPLKFLEFNQAKSNCGWIEATYCGAATLGPDMPEWDRPGITRYKDEDEFSALLGELMGDPELRQKRHKESSEYIKDNLFVSHVNMKRLEIIRELARA